VNAPPPPPGLWQSLDLKVKVIGGVIGAAAALFGLYTAYDTFIQEKQTCSFSGTVYVLGTREPAPRAFVGYSPMGQPGPPPSGLVKLAEAGPDGSYSAGCGGIEDAGGNGSFEVLTWNGPRARFPGLPCLGRDSISYSYIRIPNRGERTGVNLATRGC
jgi:hypothetical protein